VARKGFFGFIPRSQTWVYRDQEVVTRLQSQHFANRFFQLIHYPSIPRQLDTARKHHEKLCSTFCDGGVRLAGVGSSSRSWLVRQDDGSSSIILTLAVMRASDGDVKVDTNLDSTSSNRNGQTSTINGNSELNANLAPGHRMASSEIGALTAPDTAITGSKSSVSNDGQGTVGAGGDISATSGAAKSSSGSGVGSSEKTTGGGTGGGSDAFGAGAGGGAGSNVDSTDGKTTAGSLTGAGPGGASYRGFSHSQGPEAGAEAGTIAAAKGLDAITKSIAGHFGSSASGAGSGAGGAGQPGVDSGANSPA
jgi:hypothetical protein